MLVLVLLGLMGIAGMLVGAVSFKDMRVVKISGVIFAGVVICFGIVWLIENNYTDEENEENKTEEVKEETQVEDEETGADNGSLSGEGDTANEESIGLMRGELEQRIETAKEELDYTYEIKEEYYGEPDLFNMLYEYVEGSKVQLTTTITKKGNEVNRVVLELAEGYTEEDVEVLKDTIELYVNAIDVYTLDEDKGYFLGSLLSVKNGESITKVSNEVSYSSARSDKSGLMFFIERPIEQVGYIVTESK